MPRVLPLLAAWTAWCLLHSLLAARRVQQRLLPRMGRHARWYRLGYNLASAITLAPLLLWQWRVPGRPLFTWSGWWTVPRLALLLYGLYMFRAGAKAYDMPAFLGLREARAPQDAEPSGPVLHTRGVLGRVRHPWYSAGMALVWSAPPLTTANLGTALLLTLYFIFGAWVEERRLIARFGPAYEEYRRQVPMLVPGFRRGRDGSRGPR